jgi:spermidine/putrescine transport system substrate-binding protein
LEDRQLDRHDEEEAARARLPRARGLDRRQFMLRSLGAGLALTSLGPILEACGSGSGAGGAPGAAINPFPLGSPQNPVKWPIPSNNQPIASGLTPESNTTLKLYNYPDYIDKKTAVDGFKQQFAQYNVDVQISTFNDINEALAKLRTGQVDFDIFFPSYDSIGKLVTGNFLRPINHSYIPNISQVWPELTNPFYDQEWRYTTPYTIYTTGIGWSAARVKEDISARANPYEVFWDPQYSGKLAVLDDYRETIGMTLMRNQLYNLNTGDPAQLAKVSTQLTDMIGKTNPKVNITDYTDLPAAKVDITHAWSGDMISALGYLPQGADGSDLRYWFPKDNKGPVNGDIMVILKAGKNPVLSHYFINYMLDFNNALANMQNQTGYQTPHTMMTPDVLAQKGIVPANLASTLVVPAMFTTGLRELELSPTIDAAWHQVWQKFKAGA